MLELTSLRWASLSHAYGPADDIPDLLVRAEGDFRPGYPDGPWAELWSALCHQGDTYGASYAALPHLVALVQSHLDQRHWEPLLLSAWIELARLEGSGPAIPDDLARAYLEAIQTGRVLAQLNLRSAWDVDSDRVIRGSLAVFSGDKTEATALLDPDD